MTPPLTGPKSPPPPRRRLRAFAFDPNLSYRIETHDVNQVTIQLPWEESLELGPVDDYLAVVDLDPASKAFYAPVDLNHPDLLAQDGLPPSEGNPQFHQQMVYAVARTTIGHFERALGRRILWSPRRIREKGQTRYEYVDRLRIYPHALREANAYYSPVKKALLFGYFPASLSGAGENLPGGVVFSCLSHDIVAHETTHALLDGLHRRFIEPTNVDVLALHEGFSDIVALFQHFTYPDVLRHVIARTRGDLERQNLLAELAFQFGDLAALGVRLSDQGGHLVPRLVGGDLEAGGDLFQIQGLAAGEFLRAAPGDGLDAADTGADAALAEDMAETDLPGAADVGAAAELNADRRFTDADHAHRLPVLVPEEGQRPGVDRLLVGHFLGGHRQVIADRLVDQ